MVVRANKILQAHLKINKMHEVVMFVSINEVNYYSHQPSNACAEHKKPTSVR